MVVREVVDVAEHERRMADLDAYRQPCRACLHERPHAHDVRLRRPIGEAPVLVRRYRCPHCRSVWTMLPAFLAMHLWWTWRRIEQACTKGESHGPVPGRTRRRWRGRLRLSARQLLTVLMTTMHAPLCRLASAVGLDATRAALIEAARGLVPAQVFAWMAGLLQSLMPGVRLM